jgi:hypothetical protein
MVATTRALLSLQALNSDADGYLHQKANLGKFSVWESGGTDFGCGRCHIRICTWVFPLHRLDEQFQVRCCCFQALYSRLSEMQLLEARCVGRSLLTASPGFAWMLFFSNWRVQNLMFMVGYIGQR